MMSRVPSQDLKILLHERGRVQKEKERKKRKEGENYKGRLNNCPILSFMNFRGKNKNKKISVGERQLKHGKLR